MQIGLINYACCIVYLGGQELPNERITCTIEPQALPNRTVPLLVIGVIGLPHLLSVIELLNETVITYLPG